MKNSTKINSKEKTILQCYKGLYYGRNKRGLWVVLPKGSKDLEDTGAFILALDDSKTCGYRKHIGSTNNEV